jgi:hypothetical protein
MIYTANDHEQLPVVPLATNFAEEICLNLLQNSALGCGPDEFHFYT